MWNRHPPGRAVLVLMMKRRDTLKLVYLGAWLASLELAAELLFDGWAWGGSILVARGAQIAGLVIAGWGLWNLRRTLPEAMTTRTDDVAGAVRTERIMSAYTSEILTHLYSAGLLLSAALAYALVLYFRLLANLPAHRYYFLVIIATFTALTLAWFQPVRELLRERARLDSAEETPIPLG